MGWGRTWGDRNEFRSTGRRGARKSSPQFIAAWVGALARTWGDRNEFRSTGRRGARKSSPKFISAWVGGGHGATEINFGQRAGAGRGRVRRNLFRHGSALAMGDRNEFRSTGRRGARKSSPKFISAWVGGGHGATEMNFGQRAGAGRGRSPDRCGFLGKPLHAISRFRHQDAQTPPSPLVGEGGWGMRGKAPRGCRNARVSSAPGILQNDHGSPWQACIPSIKSGATRSRAPALPDARSDRPVLHRGAR
jgi:hypothetical protein